MLGALQRSSSDGITRGGWRVDHSHERTELLKAIDGEQKQIDLTASIGLLLKEKLEGVVDRKRRIGLADDRRGGHAIAR